MNYPPTLGFLGRGMTMRFTTKCVRSFRPWVGLVILLLLSASFLAMPASASRFTRLGEGSGAWAVSADGSVVVGWSDFGSGTEATRWTTSGGTERLGDLSGGNFFSQALGVSGDGSVVVGLSHAVADEEAFRWTEFGGMVGLGDLPGGSFSSIARDVLANGSVVVGFGTSANGGEAFLWTDSTGMRSVKQILETDYGLDLTGWQLFECYGISERWYSLGRLGNQSQW